MPEEQAPAVTVVVHSPLGDDKFVLRAMRMEDELGRLFVIELDLQSMDAAVNFDDLLGQSMCVEMNVGDGNTRYFHGHVTQAEMMTAASRFYVYKVTLRPFLWLLTRTRDCRIFQNKTIPEIIKTDVLADMSFPDVQESYSATYTARAYCVQYRETDFNFLSRLMEEEGIYYYFKHELTKHTLVLCDSASAHAAATGNETMNYVPGGGDSEYARQCITEWREAREFESGAYVISNFDFEKPSTKLEGMSVAAKMHSKGDYELFDYPGPHYDPDAGTTYAQIRREEAQLPWQIYRGSGNPRMLGVGNTFTLADFPRDDLNKEYLVTRAIHEFSSLQTEFAAQSEHIGYRFSSQFEAIDNTRTYRPQRTTPKPLIRGPQTAIVAGPSGDEIHTDKYGRVKLKFHWDRLSKADENSSCWIRVSQGWAGKNWGQVHLPRIGQEVIVEFLEGDPDRPIVTGRVYNNEQMPPYTLPDKMNQSGIKTRSTTGGTTETFNELRFDDTKDAEEVYFHAQLNFNRVVENNDTLKVGFDKHDKGDQTIDIYNNQVVTIGVSDAADGSQSLMIFNNQTVAIGKDGAKDGSQTVDILKNRTVTLKQGDDTLNIKQGNRTTTIDTGNDTLDIKSGEHLTKAATSITLKVGSNKIVIDQQGITLDAATITIKASGTIDVNSPKTAVAGSGLLTLQGGMVKIN